MSAVRDAGEAELSVVRVSTRLRIFRMIELMRHISPNFQFTRNPEQETGTASSSIAETDFPTPNSSNLAKSIEHNVQPFETYGTYTPSPFSLLLALLDYDIGLFDNVMLWLDTRDIVTSQKACKWLYKQLMASKYYWYANFLQFRNREKWGLRFWKFLCGRKAALKVLTIKVGSAEMEIVTSLLLRCDIRNLKIFEIYGVDIAWDPVLKRYSTLCSAHQCHWYINGNKKYMAAWKPQDVVHILQEFDPSYTDFRNSSELRSSAFSVNSPCSTDSVQILYSNCKESLTKLKLYVYKDNNVSLLSHFKNLVYLSASFVEPNRLLEPVQHDPYSPLVQLLQAIQHLNNLETLSLEIFYIFKLTRGPGYNLKSNSLKVLNLYNVDKKLYFASISCPKLTAIYGPWNNWNYKHMVPPQFNKLLFQLEEEEESQNKSIP